MRRFLCEHPLVLTAVFLVAVNDHILKQSVLAGAVTGKLSDFAGLFFFPFLLLDLLSLVRREWQDSTALFLGGAGFTGFAFVALKCKLTIAYEDTTFPVREDVYRLSDGMAFGFPSNQLVGGEINAPKLGSKVTVEDGARTCKAVLWETGNDSGLFACHRGDELECTIHLQKI